jgi:nucleoside-diphosphate-sugar epimerase
MADSRTRPRVVVTGAQGYLGSRIVAELRGAAEVIPLLRPGTNADSGSSAPLDRHFELAEKLGLLDPDHVIHAAGRVAGDPETLHRDNVTTTVALCEAIIETAPRAVLTILGSAAEYGQGPAAEPISEDHPCAPVSPYGIAKLRATRAVLECAERRGLRANVVRLFNIIDAPLSPAQVVGAFVKRAAMLRDAPPPREIVMGRLDAIRDFFALDDFITLLTALVRQERDGVLVNVCSGHGRQVREVIGFLNGLSAGRFTVREEGPLPTQASVIIGDPTRFLALAAMSEPTSVEPILRRAWREAVDPSLALV